MFPYPFFHGFPPSGAPVRLSRLREIARATLQDFNGAQGPLSVEVARAIFAPMNTSFLEIVLFGEGCEMRSSRTSRCLTDSGLTRDVVARACWPMSSQENPGRRAGRYVARLHQSQSTGAMNAVGSGDAHRLPLPRLGQVITEPMSQERALLPQHFTT